MLLLLTVAVTGVFLALGAAKLLSVAPMRERAAHVRFSVQAYRRIGVLEVAAAAGVVLGLVMPVLGVLAAVGLLLLLASATIVHLRNGDGLRGIAPALVCAVLVVGYLVAVGTTS